MPVDAALGKRATTARYRSVEHLATAAPAAHSIYRPPIPHAIIVRMAPRLQNVAYQNVVPSWNWNGWVLSPGCLFSGKA